MSDAEPSKEDVERELKNLKEEANKLSMAELKSGNWFTWLLKHALETYAKKVNAEYFETKYPGLNRDAIVDRQIALAQKYAALAGGVSASAYSAAVAATIGSAGGASPLTIPAAVASFTADLFFVSRLQLRLAYDLSVLYGYPVDLDDPEDLIALVQVAFGVKAGEELQNAAAKVAPEAVRQGVKAVAKGPVLAFLKALPVVGKYLLQRNIIKFAIPMVAIPLSGGINYFMTGRIAKTARQIFRDKGIIAEAAPKLLGGVEDDPLLFMKVVWLTMKADGKTAEEESWLLNALTKELHATEEGAEAAEAFRLMVDANDEEILAQLAEAPEELQRRIYQACCVAAAIDHKFHRKEKKLLQRIAEACCIEYDAKAVTTLVERYAV